MKLSEAIRLGSMTCPQAFNAWDDGVGKCAMMVALTAVDAKWWRPDCEIRFILGGRIVPDDWAHFLHKIVVSPVTGQKEPVVHVIMYLNDIIRWTREEIADWVEIQEVEEELRQQKEEVFT